MSLRSLLETFENSPAARQTSVSDAEGKSPDLAAARSQGFDAGYASGWEDAHKADDAARQRVAAEFERNIETLAFTYQEAVDLIRGELFAFLDAVVEKFLPSTLPDLTREHLREALRRLGEEHLVVPVELVVSSDSRRLVDELMNEDFSLEIAIVEDPTLASHQVFFRLGQRETSIDMMPLIDNLRSQLAAMNLTLRENEGKNVRA